MRKYLARHGRHFTVRLAEEVLDCRWNSLEVMDASERIAYYNVSEATLGDMVYLVNLYHNSQPLRISKARCVKQALKVVGDVNANGYAFDLWVAMGGDVDLGDYL